MVVLANQIGTEKSLGPPVHSRLVYNNLYVFREDTPFAHADKEFKGTNDLFDHLFKSFMESIRVPRAPDTLIAEAERRPTPSSEQQPPHQQPRPLPRLRSPDPSTPHP